MRIGFSPARANNVFFRVFHRQTHGDSAPVAKLEKLILCKLRDFEGHILLLDKAGHSLTADQVRALIQ